MAPVVVPAQRMGGSGERRPQTRERERELLDPGPRAVESQGSDPPAPGEARGHVQDAVAEGGDLAAGELRVVCQADELRPADEVGCGEHELKPDVVLRHLLSVLAVAELRRLEAAGATVVGPVETWVVLEDPAGLFLCVIPAESDDFDSASTACD